MQFKQSCFFVLFTMIGVFGTYVCSHKFNICFPFTQIHDICSTILENWNPFVSENRSHIESVTRIKNILPTFCTMMSYLVILLISFVIFQQKLLSATAENCLIVNVVQKIMENFCSASNEDVHVIISSEKNCCYSGI